MTFLEVYGIAGLVILGLMTALWLVSLLLKDSSIVDMFWGAGFVLTAWVYFAFTDGFVWRKALLEKTLQESKPHYREYIETTSAFIPWFPKKRPVDPGRSAPR